jgi:magnesium chelatase family protein
MGRMSSCSAPWGGEVDAGALADHYPAAMILPEALETTCIHCVAGRTGARTAVVTRRPCRAPPHPMAEVDLIRGGQVSLPGEVSLAHHGICFLDELPEFRRHVLTVRRQPLEESVI